MKEAGALGVTMVRVLSHVVTAISPGQGNVKISHSTEGFVKGLQWNSGDAMSTCHALVWKPSIGNILQSGIALSVDSRFNWLNKTLKESAITNQNKQDLSSQH